MIGWFFAFLALAVAVETALSFSRHWLFALASHFRPHLAAFALLVAVVVLLSGLPGWAKFVALVLSLGALAVNAFEIWRTLPRAPMTAAEEGPTLKIAFANLLKTNTDRASVIAWLSREKVDLFIAAEAVGDWPEALEVLRTDLPYGPQQTFGDLMIFARHPVAAVRHPVTRFGNAVVVDLETAGGPLAVLALHASVPANERYTTGRDAMLETVGHIVWRQKDGIVVIGDFNATPWSRPLRRLLAGGKLAYGPGAFRGSFPAWLPDWAGIPIDLVLAGGGWRVSAHRHGPRIGSDHYPVVAEVVTKKPA
jgi:endonuclease/exonuclease/phosphatase (EEP) superfamily protein YafD